MAHPPAALPIRAPIFDRVVAALGAAACLAVLIVAARLHPDSHGNGTHTQLGLPPCGWFMATGYPCPTCGMTTSFSLMAHHRPYSAFHVQPMGALLCLASAAALWGFLHVALFGSHLGRIAGRLLRPGVLWPVAGLWAAAWVYKIIIVRSG